MKHTEKKKKIESIATEILALAKDDLSIRMHFLTAAFHRLTPTCIPELNGMATDGSKFFFDPIFVLNAYKIEINAPERAFLHSVVHCLLKHPFRIRADDEMLWNTCADIATENIILDMNFPTSTALNDRQKESMLADLQKKLGFLTAEKLYAYFVETKTSSEEMDTISRIFNVDKHRFWMKNMHIEKEVFKGDLPLPASFHEMALEWENIATMSRSRLQTSDASLSESIYSLLEGVSPQKRKKKTYAEFLKKFIVMDEEMKVSLDEFDYALYTHGLNLYENMPLIEPLEYRESEKIKEFVIAIDTSGSCQGKPVIEFLRRTYDIMKNTEKFFNKINFYILQADDRIRSVTHITRDEDFDHYIKTGMLNGFGDTDFRPVFRYVDALVLKGSLKNLKGLIYFTDGFGIFPEWVPRYDSIFVFLKENNNAKEIPAWAIKAEFD